MNRKIILLLGVLVLTGCSKETVKENNNPNPDQPFVSNDGKLSAAESKFIDGSILEIKGQLDEAIGKYIEAARIDPQPGIYYSIAKNYYRLNKLPSSLSYAKKAVSGDSGNVEYRTLLATIYSASHLEDSSAFQYNKIIGLDSANVAAYFNLAQLDEPKRPSESIKLYKKVIEIVGPEWNVLVKLIDLNERMGNIGETIKMVEELLKLNPSDLMLQKALIDAYLKTKDFDRAMLKVTEAMMSFPDDVNLIELKGKILIEKGNWEGASDEFLKLTQSTEINYESKIRMGTAFFLAAEKDSNNIKLAKKIFRAIDKDTSDWQVKAYLGEIGIREKKDSLAIEYFKKAAELAEWNAQVWIRLGGLLFDTRKYKEAISYLSKASVKFPNDFAVNLIYGLALSQENDFLTAKTVLKNALNINPNDVTALSALGYSLNQLKENEEALIHLQKALSLDPNNLQVISITALIYESKKEYRISDSLYTRALAIDSTNALILNNYSYSFAERGINLEKALAMSRKAVDAEPKNASYLDTIGWIYFRLGQLGEARKEIEKALTFEEKNATMLDHLGDIYSMLGQKIKSKEYWQKAFDIDASKTEIKMKIEKGEL